MKPYYEDERVTIYHGDSLDILAELDGVGAVVTDPPYSSDGAFRGDWTRSVVAKYVSSTTAAYQPEFAGENIKALSEYLGHADPGFTLRVYTHLMKASAERTRKAVDGVFGEAGVT